MWIRGKYLDLSDMDEIWNRLIPSMKESCTDISGGKQYRICTNMTMAGFFYNKEIFAELGIEPATTWEGFCCESGKRLKPRCPMLILVYLRQRSVASGPSD